MVKQKIWIKCPECDFKSTEEKITRVHHYRWHILKTLGKLIFNNPCFGCLNPREEMKVLSLQNYQKLCMTHRELYDGKENPITLLHNKILQLIQTESNYQKIDGYHDVLDEIKRLSE